MENRTGLEDFKINVRVKLSALWVSVMFCYVYGDYFELYVPQKTNGLVTGENMLNSPIRLFAASILLVIPALMVFFSLALKSTFSRGLNIGLGIFYTALMLLIAVTSLTPWMGFYIFFAIIESILTSFIVWYAWKWPRSHPPSAGIAMD